MTDTDYADDQVLLTNTSAGAETILHSLEQAGKGIVLFVNANKKLMWFKKRVPSLH